VAARRSSDEVISSEFDRSFNDISDGILYELNGGSKTLKLELGGWKLHEAHGFACRNCLWRVGASDSSDSVDFCDDE
jgi:hypothetical protein